MVGSQAAERDAKSPAEPGIEATEAPDAGLRRLALGFFALVAITSSLVVLGALVRAHDAGLACPDWPLCFGDFVPEMNLQVAFEWGHRVLAGSVSLIFATLAFLCWRQPAARRAVRIAVPVAAGLLAVQVLLGALTVWQLLASWTVTSHLLTGNSFNAALLVTGLTLRDAAQPRAAVPAATPRARAVLAAVAGVLLLQMILGGLVASRYAGMSCPEWPTCNGGLWFPSWQGNVGLHLVHRMNGYALLISLAAALPLLWHDRGLRPVAALGLGLGLAQVAVGVANVVLALPVEVTGLHSALAAGLVLTVAWGLREAWRDRSGALRRGVV